MSRKVCVLFHVVSFLVFFNVLFYSPNAEAGFLGDVFSVPFKVVGKVAEVPFRITGNVVKGTTKFVVRKGVGAVLHPVRTVHRLLPLLPYTGRYTRFYKYGYLFIPMRKSGYKKVFS